MSAQADWARAVKGMLHCHSTFSDGEYTLPELRELFLPEGLAFAFVTDHADFFDETSLRAYVDECASLSDDRFRFVPGLEYGCERRMHVLGYGVTSLVHTTDPQLVIKHIDAAGGVSVIAHPADAMFDWIETFETLPAGLEVWNSKYDGRSAPRPGTFRLLARLQQRHPALRAFYGTDLHWRHQFHALWNVVDAGPATRDELLALLKRGEFTAVTGDLKLPSSGHISDELMREFGRISARHQRRQKVFKRVKRLLGVLGRRLPSPLKARLRRMLS